MAKIKERLYDFKKHWNTPPKGKYVPFKEIAAYGVGGMGVHFSTTLASAIALSASNFLVGSALGIDPVHLQTMSIIASIFGFAVTMLRSYLFDNSKSKSGKFRPWLKWMGLPTVISSILFVWMPYEKMTYSEKVITVELCFLLINCFSPFFTEAFNLIVQVMSPNTEERTDIMSIGQIVFSFAPTITNLVIPALAPLTGGLNDIKTYRIIYPVFTLIGLGLTYFIYSGTKERIIYSKNETRSVRFTDAVRSAAKNKYFWITNVATWIGFLESAYLTIHQWTFVYAMPDKQGWLGVANTVIGNGALWAMLIAPFLIKRFGKRNLLIWCNLANIILLASLYISFQNIWFVMIICYLNNFINVFGNIYNPGIQADMKDYHQWKTGERIDGMFGVLGIIGTVIGFGTGYVVPALYRMCGLNTDYNVLYDAAIRNNIFRTLIIASIIGAFFNFIPYLFYDLTEQKHYGIIKVIKLRAGLGDYTNKNADIHELKVCADIIKSARALYGKEKKAVEKPKRYKPLPLNASPEDKAKRKEERKAQRDKRNAVRQLNKDIEAAEFVSKELNKFSTRRYKAMLALAEHTVKFGVDGILNMDTKAYKAEIKKYSGKSKEEKLIRSDIREQIRSINIAQRLTRKYYPKGIHKPENDRLEKAENTESKSLSDTVKKKREIHKALKEISVYKRCTMPYSKATELIALAESYKNIDRFLDYCDKIEEDNLNPVAAKI